MTDRADDITGPGDRRDIVDRLRAGQRDLSDVLMGVEGAAFDTALPAYLGEAADEIERLRAIIRPARVHTDAEIEAALDRVMRRLLSPSMLRPPPDEAAR